MAGEYKFKRLYDSGSGRVARIERMVDALAEWISAFKAEGGRISIQKNAEGGVTLSARGGGAGGGGARIYRSFFRIVNAGDNKIAVTDGRAEVGGASCGWTKVNGTRLLVSEFVSDELAADGTYYVWIHSWMSATGPASEIVLTQSPNEPDNPNEGLAYASEIIGRVTVEDGAIISITQDYLKGGDHTELLFRDCDSVYVACEELPEPEE